MTQANETPPTIITLTLPTPEGGGISLERATATLLIQRGELAHLDNEGVRAILKRSYPEVAHATIRETTLEDFVQRESQQGSVHQSYRAKRRSNPS